MQLPVSITTHQKSKLEQLVEVFLHKNQQLNLSAIRDQTGVWQKHIYDSLLILKNSPSSSLMEEGAELLDVGSGGGFPALPLAICVPSLEITALDSVNKKMQAVAAMASELELNNLQILVGRCEDLGQNNQYREQFDLVTARAVANWATLLELTTPFVKVGGHLILYLGPSAIDNDLDLPVLFSLELVEQKEFSLPNGEKRLIWTFQKTKSLNKKYPRANGLPKKQPVTL